MKKNLLLFLLLVTGAITHAQIEIPIDPKPNPNPPQGNVKYLRQLKDKSFVLTFYYYTGDTIPDRLLIKETNLINAANGNYCVMFSDDTTRVAISIVKLEGDKGYTVTTYRVDGKLRRVYKYDINIIPTGEWEEYYDNGKMKSEGEYTNGKKTGKWKYYDVDGQKLRTEDYQPDGTVVTKNDKKD
jgi:antitoxin component YwqK of YwqJK toxin-antitoxin module